MKGEEKRGKKGKKGKGEEKKGTKKKERGKKKGKREEKRGQTREKGNGGRKREREIDRKREVGSKRGNKQFYVKKSTNKLKMRNISSSLSNLLSLEEKSSHFPLDLEIKMKLESSLYITCKVRQIGKLAPIYL